MYTSIIIALIFVFLLSLIGTGIVNIIFRFLGKRGYLGNLFPNVRGGIPRAVGIVPFVILAFYFLPGYNSLILIIGVFALIDDILGRKKSPFGVEWGQLSRGIGMILVVVAGYLMGLGVSSLFIALLVQPLNISDMQPGSACIVTMIMSVVTMIMMVLFASPDVAELPAFYTPVLLLIVVLGYCPLDFSGKIMLGEVGNHVFAIALGVSFYMVGGLWSLIFLFIVTTALIAFVRRNTLKVFFRQNLRLLDPTFGDYFMDVLTGGGLGDLLRKWILKDKQYDVTNPLLISLGFRRLLYNPHADHPQRYVPKNQKVRLGRQL
ncbi:cell wall biosynthesis protein [uncultured Methanobrevibacter sp.]|uniref:cell wall biosynthesis protein n=1 Tax=uncultured Methanobrevibacter sp. TaxID=253161 RepID=UPI0025E337DB|nr:cell wall biosynthesis protein [uncultured Methanobrevibacter sp.]